MTRRRNPEDQFQRSVAELLDSLGWLWWHTPNGGWRTKAEAGGSGRPVSRRG